MGRWGERSRIRPLLPNTEREREVIAIRDVRGTRRNTSDIAAQNEVMAVVGMTVIAAPIGRISAIKVKAGAERRATGTNVTRIMNLRKGKFVITQ